MTYTNVALATVKRGSTFTFTRDTSYIASCLVPRRLSFDENTLPMVPCGLSPVTRFALFSAMQKTKRLRSRLHCLYFIYAGKIYLPADVKIMRQCPSTLTYFLACFKMFRFFALHSFSLTTIVAQISCQKYHHIKVKCC